MNTQNLARAGSDLERLAKRVNVGSGFFDITDPADGAGIKLKEKYGLCQTYQAERTKVELICETLYSRVYEKIKTGGLGDARVKLVQYVQRVQDVNRSTIPDQRFYIIATRDTLRSTRASILLRFYGYGDHLYLAIDSHVLGEIAWKSFFKKVFFSFLAVFFFLPLLLAIPTLLMGLVGGSAGSALSGSFLGFVLSVGLIVWLWWDLIKRLVQNQWKLGISLRQVFPRTMELGSFNYDDIMMFFKSTLLVSVLEVRKVLKEEGFDVETLDSFVQNLNLSNTFSGPVDTVIGIVEGGVNTG